MRVKVMRSKSFPYSPGLRTRLTAVRLDARDICLLNFELGEQFAEAAADMLKAAVEEGCEVDFVASAGHRAAHYPPRGPGESVGTLEIGEPAVIAERTGLPVVSDFRPRDMAAGGQGAPLRAYALWLLFRREDRTVVCLNLGGIAAFTVVTPQLEEVLAFDVGPGTIAIDGVARLLTVGTHETDPDGSAAAKGVVIDEFLDYLLSHPFFGRVPPKSTSRGEFAPEVYLRDAFLTRRDHPYEDLVATVTAALAYSIIRAYSRFIKPQYQAARLIASGCGVLNKTLTAHIRKGMPEIPFRTSDDYGLAHDACDAVAYAVLGNETLSGVPANIPYATGARHPVILGKLTPA
jgi:anhydro-N-acetylmuramic acid kinase